MMKRTYESPEFECFKLTFEAMMDNIQYSKDENFHQSGYEGNEDEIP